MARQHDDHYERALSDPEFLEAVRTEYSGGWEVLDALWWAAHPLDAAPSGRAAPLVRLRALQRRVFAADADAADDHAVLADLQELEAEIAREALALQDAALAAERPADRAVGRPSDRPVEHPVVSGDRFAAEAMPHPPLLTEAGASNRSEPAEESARPDGVDPGARSRPSRRRRTALLGAGLVLALVAAAFLGAVAEAQLAAARPPGAGSAPEDSATPSATPPPLALTIFVRDQTPDDTPAIALPAMFDPTTVHQLGSLGWNDADPARVAVYYAVRSTSNMVCLFLVQPDLEYLSTCALEQDFPATGLRLYWKSEALFTGAGAGVEAGSEAAPADAYVVWYSDGSVEAGAQG